MDRERDTRSLMRERGESEERARRKGADGAGRCAPPTSARVQGERDGRVRVGSRRKWHGHVGGGMAAWEVACLTWKVAWRGRERRRRWRHTQTPFRAVSPDRHLDQEPQPA